MRTDFFQGTDYKFNNVADLRNFYIETTGSYPTAMTRSQNALGDGGGMIYYFDPHSIAGEDVPYVITPTNRVSLGAPIPGRWIAIGVPRSVYVSQVLDAISRLSALEVRQAHAARVTGPTHTILHNTLERLPLTSLSFQRGNIYANLGQHGRIEIKRAGIYQITGFVTWSGGTSGARVVYIRQQPPGAPLVTPILNQVGDASGGNTVVNSFSGLANAVVGTEFYVEVLQTSGSSRNCQCHLSLSEVL